RTTAVGAGKFVARAWKDHLAISRKKLELTVDLVVSEIGVDNAIHRSVPQKGVSDELLPRHPHAQLERRVSGLVLNQCHQLAPRRSRCNRANLVCGRQVSHLGEEVVADSASTLPDADNLDMHSNIPFQWEEYESTSCECHARHPRGSIVSNLFPREPAYSE